VCDWASGEVARLSSHAGAFRSSLYHPLTLFRAVCPFAALNASRYYARRFSLGLLLLLPTMAFTITFSSSSWDFPRGGFLVWRGFAPCCLVSDNLGGVTDSLTGSVAR